MNLKWQVALSPVRRWSCDIDNIVAVCLMLPTCTTIYISNYNTLLAVGDFIGSC